jgi:CBS-domain-containing membrane protein
MTAKLPGRLGTLTARDVMTGDIITVSESDTIESAVAQLKEQHISGAPVIDDRGRFVGILSLADLVVGIGGEQRSSGTQPTALAHGHDVTTWDLFDRANPLDRDIHIERVSQRMSRQTVSVAEYTPLVEVARVMCDGHWHRVPVVSDAGQLCGIISSMDILAALVNAADEAR